MQLDAVPKPIGVAEAMAEIAAIERVVRAGACDEEPDRLQAIRGELERNEITPEEAIARAKKIEEAMGPDH